MKISTLFFLLPVLAAPFAQAASFEDTARVVSVTERTERVNRPIKECGEADTKTDRGLSGSVIGGLTGALLGAQVGKGNGRVAGAAVGAVTGAVVGDRMQNGGTQNGQNCRMVDDWQTRSMGYSVTYEYHGTTITDYMKDDPGQVIRVRVNVTPTR
jgi:uncharacterized protein YcfJ